MTTLLNIPQELQGYTWRPFRREDVPALYEMMMAVDRADQRHFIMTLKDMETQYDDPWSTQRWTHCWLLRRKAGWRRWRVCSPILNRWRMSRSPVDRSASGLPWQRVGRFCL